MRHDIAREILRAPIHGRIKESIAVTVNVEQVVVDIVRDETVLAPVAARGPQLLQRLVTHTSDVEHMSEVNFLGVPSLLLKTAQAFPIVFDLAVPCDRVNVLQHGVLLEAAKLVPAKLHDLLERPDEQSNEEHYQQRSNV